ncbi:MAG: laminin G domain-containing protein [Candidatus Auribacterota bacterium]|nr:laminin G domain-containing protein [Candidatus Auribacterota bacterium]
MNRNKNATITNICWLTVLAVLTGLCYSWMYYAMFTKFHIYDDEGYLLLTVNQFVKNGGLYEQFQSLYGPFYYFYNWVVHKLLSLPVNHNITRLQTVFEWIAVCACASLLVKLVTGSLMLSIMVFLQMIPATYNLTNEPGHPQGILIVCMVSFFITLFLYIKNMQKRWLLLLASLLCVAVFMNKLHIGTFLFCAVLLAIISHGDFMPRLRVVFKCLISSMLLIIPYMIMHRHLDTFWGLSYFCVVMGALIPVIIAVNIQTSSHSFTIRDIFIFIISFFAGTALLIFFINSHGTSWNGILRGLILKPILFPTMNVDPAVFWPKSRHLALFSIVLGSVYFFVIRRFERRSFVVWIMLIIKLCFVLAIFTALLERYYRLLNYIMPFIWVIFTPASTIKVNTRYLLFLSIFVLFVALNAIHAYPVCGSQYQWATFLLIPLAAFCLADIHKTIGMQVLHTKGSLLVLSKIAVYGLIPISFIAIYIDSLLINPKYTRDQYNNLISLNLSGADKIHLSADQAGRYQWLTSNLKAHSDMFVSMPGYMSYYFWTNTPPPDYFTSSGWTIVYDDSEQQRVVNDLKRSSRPCAIVNQEGIDFWANPGQSLRQGPLVRYINESFATALSCPPFELRLLNDRPHTGISNYLWYGTITLTGKPQDCLSCPHKIINKEFSVVLWFKTTKSGVLLQVQNRTDLIPEANQPLLYVGTDGFLYGNYPLDALSLWKSYNQVNDGQWHRVAYSCDGSRISIYLDNNEPAHVAIQPVSADMFPFTLIGSGYMKSFPNAPKGWFPFTGELRDIILSDTYLKSGK